MAAGLELRMMRVYPQRAKVPEVLKAHPDEWEAEALPNPRTAVGLAGEELEPGLATTRPAKFGTQCLVGTLSRVA